MVFVPHRVRSDRWGPNNNSINNSTRENQRTDEILGSVLGRRDMNHGRPGYFSVRLCIVIVDSMCVQSQTQIDLYLYPTAPPGKARRVNELHS
jgi:hypothetical protein